jgi:hypothetical protein
MAITASTAPSFDLNTVFDPNWEEDSAQRIFSGMADPEKKQVDQTVVETGVKSLQPERSYTPAKEGSGRLTSDMTGNPLDDFEAPLKKEAPKEAPVVESEQDEQPSIGKIIADGHNYISQIKAVQSGRFGKTREVQREKALDNQAIFQAYSAMQARLSERGYDDPTLVATLGTYKGGGLRSAEDIDRLFEIKKNGLQYQTKEGNIAKLEKNAPWSAIVDAADEVGGITIMKPSDPGKDFGQLADNLKKAEDSYTAVKDSDDESAKARAKSIVELYEGQLNAATEGKFFRDRHAGIQQNLLTAINHLNNPKVNYKGVAYDQVDKSKPEDNLSSNDFFEQAATKGMMPTVTMTPTGFNTDAVEEYVNYYGVDKTLAAAYNKKGGFDFFEYSHKDKKLTPLLGKAAEAPLPKTESTSGIDKALQEIEAREAVSSAKSREAEIAEIDAEIARVSSLMTERREGGFMPSGYSAPVSGRAKTKEELQQSKLKIQKLEQRRAMLRGK